MRFEWDASKAAENETKHDITFIEAATAFDDDLAIVLPDPDHSTYEYRYLLLGKSSRGRLLVVSHTETDDVIRIISAREPTRRERRDYEEG